MKKCLSAFKFLVTLTTKSIVTVSEEDENAQIHLMFVSFYQWAPLHIAAKEGFGYIVVSLVENGANIKTKDKNGVSVTGIVVDLTL